MYLRLWGPSWHAESAQEAQQHTLIANVVSSIPTRENEKNIDFPVTFYHTLNANVVSSILTRENEKNIDFPVTFYVLLFSVQQQRIIISTHTVCV